MAENKIKQLRDFIKKHEMRYYACYSEYSGKTFIKKAFKAEVNNEVYWVHFSYGDRPSVLSQMDVKYNLFASIEDAKARTEKLRADHKKKMAAEKKQKQAKLEDVTEYLKGFRMWDARIDYGQEIKPEYQGFVDAIKKLYYDMPDREKMDTQSNCIKLLSDYIRTGTFYTQGISFRKENVVCVKHGKGNAVEIELINGTKIKPVSENFCFLIKTVFNSSDSWEYNFFYPTGKHDEIKEPKHF
jgi:hypothetical protein